MKPGVLMMCLMHTQTPGMQTRAFKVYTPTRLDYFKAVRTIFTRELEANRKAWWEGAVVLCVMDAQISLCQQCSETMTCNCISDVAQHLLSKRSGNLWRCSVSVLYSQHAPGLFYHWF